MASEGRGLKLLHVTTVPQSLYFLAGQVRYIRAQGFEVTAASSPGDDLERFAQAEQIETFAIPMTRRITPLHDLIALARLWRCMRRLRPTIVHAHTPKGGLLGMIAARLAGAPVRIYHIRGLPLTTAKGNRRRLLRWTERIACRLAHHVLCVSHSIRRTAVAEGICPAYKVETLLKGSGNGVDAERRFNPARVSPTERAEVRRRYGVPDHALLVGFVGRIVRDKGIVELEEAWRRLSQKHNDLHLLVVGPFESQDPIPLDVAQRLRSDRRVHLAGMTWNTPPLYAAMDVVVLPSWREGFPNVPLEAAAMERPVVATTAAGCVDAVVHEQTGLLVPVGDAAALAEAIERYLNSAELRRRHGKSGRLRTLAYFRPEQVWQAVHQRYQALLQQRGLAPADAVDEPRRAA